MIDEAHTLKLFGYTSDELGKWSKKPIAVVCEKCGEPRTCRNDSYRDLCMSCVQKGKRHSLKTRAKMRAAQLGEKSHSWGKHLSNEQKMFLSDINTGENHPNFGKHLSTETRYKISQSEKGKPVSDETKQKLALSHTGLTQSEETRHRRSATRQGITYDDWDGYTDKHRPHLTPIHACYQLNKWFNGCDGHHITSSIIIFIPGHTHRSVPHNMATGVGMDKINSIAIDFLYGIECNTPQTKLSAF